MIGLICYSLSFYAQNHPCSPIAILTRNKRQKLIPKQYVLGSSGKFDCVSKTLDTAYSLSLISQYVVLIHGNLFQKKFFLYLHY